jgi:hypothetical protein
MAVNMKHLNLSIFNSKNIIKRGLIISFGVFIFIFILFKVNSLFLPKRINLPWNISSKIKGFYLQPKNSLDIVFIGSSHAFCTFNPSVFYKEASIKSYVFASNEQPLWTSYFYIKEALKYQKPKAIVLEAFYISETKEFKREAVNRLNIDYINASENKHEMIIVSEGEQGLMNIFPSYRYHNRWKKLDYNDFNQQEYGFLKGYSPLFKQSSKEFSPNIKNIVAKPLLEKSKIWLKKIIDYCKEEKVPLIFVYAPYQVNASHLSHINTLKKTAIDNDITFYNFTDSTLLSTINYDFTKDMEGGHVNINGAQKVSRYLAQELKRKYSFEKKDSDDYISLVKRLEIIDSLPKIKTLNNYINYLKDKDVSIFIAAKDEASAKLTKQLKDLGSTVNWKDKNRWSYIGIFQPKNNLRTEIIRNERITYLTNKNLKQPFNLNIESAGYTNGNTAKIYINGIDYLKGKSGRGLHFVVYDVLLNKVLDISYFDTCANSNPERNKIGG